MWGNKLNTVYYFLSMRFRCTVVLVLIWSATGRRLPIGLGWDSSNGRSGRSKMKKEGKYRKNSRFWPKVLLNWCLISHKFSWNCYQFQCAISLFSSDVNRYDWNLTSRGFVTIHFTLLLVLKCSSESPTHFLSLSQFSTLAFIDCVFTLHKKLLRKTGQIAWLNGKKF